MSWSRHLPTILISLWRKLNIVADDPGIEADWGPSISPTAPTNEAKPPEEKHATAA
jgi:hypothetical protein